LSFANPENIPAMGRRTCAKEENPLLAAHPAAAVMDVSRISSRDIVSPIGLYKE
jgi:hypothetical protein